MESVEELKDNLHFLHMGLYLDRSKPQLSMKRDHL